MQQPRGIPVIGPCLFLVWGHVASNSFVFHPLPEMAGGRGFPVSPAVTLPLPRSTTLLRLGFSYFYAAAENFRQGHTPPAADGPAEHLDGRARLGASASAAELSTRGSGRASTSRGWGWGWGWNPRPSFQRTILSQVISTVWAAYDILEILVAQLGAPKGHDDSSFVGSDGRGENTGSAGRPSPWIIPAR